MLTSKSIVIRFIATSCLLLSLSACVSTEDMAFQQYGHPSLFSSADEWMANSYIYAYYVDSKPVSWSVTGMEKHKFTNYADAKRAMKERYARDYHNFFLPYYKKNQQQ